MPTYPYACTQCGHQFEVFQSFSDDALTECPECTGALRKVWGSVGVVFKGSGFYRNDSRSDSKGSSSKSSTGSSSTGSSTSSSDSSSSSSSSSSTGSSSTSTSSTGTSSGAA
ncbi:zinc ribbon domain-containing protein [Luteipulveratus sp. YIM 133132]|uniref:FmdB family zinc ribbon protein n=1 Tax=Luteipulveratus flavus TaxID=3031728 RepID=UPI0023B12522|nr:FmdB family zinc ribbon protein [Luteipulveratus sp. YIM 133132]MDE9364239.1 zinc ribbon domain-containing protein [Luteipulveratus sp. YIM 133132]